MYVLLLLIAGRDPKCGSLGWAVTKAAQSLFSATFLAEEEGPKDITPADPQDKHQIPTPEPTHDQIEHEFVEIEAEVEPSPHIPETVDEIPVVEEPSDHTEPETPNADSSTELTGPEVLIEEHTEIINEEVPEPTPEAPTDIPQESVIEEIKPYQAQDAVSAFNTIQSIWRYLSEPGIDFTSHDIFDADIVLPSELVYQPGIECTKGFVSRAPLLRDGHWSYSSAELFSHDQFLFQFKLFNNKPYLIHGVRFGPIPDQECAPKKVIIGVINEQKRLYFSFNKTLAKGNAHEDVLELPGHIPGNQVSIRVLSNHGDDGEICLYPVEIYGRLDL